MGLPELDIQFDNGTIGAVIPSEDGVFGVLANAIATADFELGKPYPVKSMRALAKLGIIDNIDNSRLYKFVNEFFQQAGEGTELWIMGYDDTTGIDNLFTNDPRTGIAFASKLLNASRGRIKGLFTVHQNRTVPDPSAPINPFISIIPNAQIFAQNYTKTKYAPLFIIIEGFGFDFADPIALPDLTIMKNNRVGILIGDTRQAEITGKIEGAAIGILAGRLARIGVHQNPGKPIDGSVTNESIYIGNELAEDYDVEALHNKGYITFRTHTNKSGYFFTHALLATEIDDDYRQIPRRRVIDKAYRLTYDVLIDELLNEVPVTKEGTVSPIYAKVLEGQIVNKIYTQMTLNGQLSFDPSDTNDKGCIAKVNVENNFLATGNLEVIIKVKPFGYNEYITVKLGFDTNNN